MNEIELVRVIKKKQKAKWHPLNVAAMLNWWNVVYIKKENHCEIKYY
ncbi:MAG: hypothetical protein WCS51_02440 [Bacilli bacterium]